jgi:hypothetical protein
MDIERAVILSKVESTYGQDATPAAADAIVCSIPEIKVNGEKIERKAAGASKSPWAHRIGIKDIEISFEVELRGYGAAYSASNLPEVSPLLRSCGLSETVDATPGSENVVYQPVSSSFESCTIYYYDDGHLYKLLGCRGNPEFTMEAGKTGIAKFTMKALYAAPVDQTLITPTYQDVSVLPPVFLSATLTVGSWTPVVNKFGLNLGNEMASRKDANAAAGLIEQIITARKATGGVDPEAVALATENPWTKWSGGTAQAIAATLGDTQYNKVQFSVPKAVYDAVNLADREKRRVWDIPFVCARDTGDDELVITYD